MYRNILIMFKNIIIIFILLLLILFIYYLVIKTYFRIKNNIISYHTLLNEYIHKVSENNYYMNYGLWEKNTSSLINANKNQMSIPKNHINKFNLITNKKSLII